MFVVFNSSSLQSNLGAQECQICQLLVGFAENFIKSDDTQQMILEKLEALCNKTPFASVCNSFVRAYLPKLIEELLNKETPIVACTQLGVCKASRKMPFEIANKLAKNMPLH